MDTTRNPDPTTRGVTQRGITWTGVRELRGELADAVRRAAAGDRTVITSHGRPVAQLGPLDDAAPDLDRLISAGSLVPPRRHGDWRPPAPGRVWSGVRIDQALRELRG